MESEIFECRQRLQEFVQKLEAELRLNRRVAEDWEQWDQSTHDIVLWFQATREDLKNSLLKAGKPLPKSGSGR